MIDDEMNTPAPKLPKPPKQLRGLALREWRRVAPTLFESGVLAEVDVAELAFYCATFARWQAAEETLLAEGVLHTTKSGNTIQHPALGIANRAMQLCHKFADAVGMSPKSRGQVKPLNPDELAPPGLRDELPVPTYRLRYGR